MRVTGRAGRVGEREEGEGEGGRYHMITTLFHATTSSHPRGQHDQSPAQQRVRGGRRERKGGKGEGV